MVRLGRATGDDQLINKAIALYEGWSKTLPPDGNARMRLYDWDKLVCGLVDLAHYGGVSGAIAALKKSVEWAARTFDRARQPADRHDFWGAGPGDTASLPYFTVEDMPAAIERVTVFGGVVVHPGERWAVCRDSEGSPFGLALAISDD